MVKNQGETLEVYKKFVGALYVMNIIAQSIVTLLTPAALMFFFAWLLVEKCSLPRWIYAVFITVGVIAGLISMVKFAISASEGLERLERAGRKKENKTSHGEKNEEK